MPEPGSLEAHTLQLRQWNANTRKNPVMGQIDHHKQRMQRLRSGVHNIRGT
jgi:hypothetical protein